MRLRINHSTTYRYDPAATGVIQMIRKTPRSFDGQYVAEWQISVSTDSMMQMHQDAFPGEDISDRPPPEAVVPALRALLRAAPPSGRYRASDVAVSA